MNNRERSIKMKKWILIILLFTGMFGRPSGTGRGSADTGEGRFQ